MEIFAAYDCKTFQSCSPLAPASEVVRGHAVHFWKQAADTNPKKGKKG
jgi:hypothetical protein